MPSLLREPLGKSECPLFLGVLIRPALAPAYGKVEGVWAGEHLLPEANSADLMYDSANAQNRQLATVKFTVTTQQEIWVRTAEGLV